MKRLPCIVCGILMCLLVLTSGCQTKEQTSGTRSQGYDITDVQGMSVHMEGKPERIITLSMETDEIVLGMVPEQQMVAVNALLDDPAESPIVNKAEKISTKITDPSVETIVSLRPDLVIVPDWGNLEKVKPLRDLGLKVVVCRGARNFSEVRENVRLIAQAIGDADKGEAMVQCVDEKIREIERKVAKIPMEKRKKIVLISLMNTYGGSGCIFDDSCHYAGVINGMSEAGIRNGQAMSKEKLVEINPDYLFLPSYNNHGQYDPEAFIKEYLNDPALQTIKAVRENHLVKPRESYIYNGSQDAVYGIQEIAFAVYGDEFAQPDGCHISVLDES